MKQAVFTSLLSGLDTEEKRKFYIALIRNITISVRVIWSDEDLLADERIERMKWMNEAIHRVINRISDISSELPIWTDDDIWYILQDIVSQYPSINGDLGTAVQDTIKSYSNTGRYQE